MAEANGRRWLHLLGGALLVLWPDARARDAFPPEVRPPEPVRLEGAVPLGEPLPGGAPLELDAPDLLGLALRADLGPSLEPRGAPHAEAPPPVTLDPPAGVAAAARAPVPEPPAAALVAAAGAWAAGRRRARACQPP